MLCIVGIAAVSYIDSLDLDLRNPLGGLRLRNVSTAFARKISKRERVAETLTLFAIAAFLYFALGGEFWAKKLGWLLAFLSYKA